ncbi:MAG: PQQ-dependent sugar dehydrogenase [Candidatus Nitrosothermus koennekii]|nr:MAG: PQQ-dependent sugar dehydrogenase [Candidatus Nitrosothermus koennekii]
MERKNILIAIAIAGVLIVSVMNLTLPRNPPPIPDLGIERITTMATDLEVPWAIDIFEDKIYFTERVGRVNVIEDGVVKTIFTKNVANIGEGGMLGLALDPDFATNNYIYIYYTYAEEGQLWNRVVRLEKIDDEYKESLILIDKIPGDAIHNGGRIKFGPDGKLYITTGDANRDPLAQSLDSLAGKILRINKDGSIPEDNPFNNAIYSYGHRNPQGLAWHPVTNQLYATEHGPVGFDEVNLIIAGNNYGWPEEQCGIKYMNKYTDAIFCYSVTVAPAGADFYNNDLYIATLRGQHVERLSIINATVVDRSEFVSGLGRIRDVVVEGDYMYIATSNRDGRGSPNTGDDKILRISLQ